MSKNTGRSTERLYMAICGLSTPEECRTFFDDICTIKEVHDMAQRLEIAEMLDGGESYQAICEKTGASTTTIGRVNRCLKYGDGGYRSALDRLAGKED